MRPPKKCLQAEVFLAGAVSWSRREIRIEWLDYSGEWGHAKKQSQVSMAWVGSRDGISAIFLAPVIEGPFADGPSIDGEEVEIMDPGIYRVRPR